MLRKVKTALISVSDKTGIVEFSQFLASQNIKILSTGGTASLLRENGLDVTDVSDHTGFPEMLDGRVKTLHPKVHGGILGRRDMESHQVAMAEHDIDDIDMVVINLYPFEETVARGADFDESIENIDIGGPAMIRSAAKNHNDVAVLLSADDYESVHTEMEANDGATTLELRKRLAYQAYARTAAYDSAISTWFATQVSDDLPSTFSVAATIKQPLRYGENPHQRAAFYQMGDITGTLAGARQLQGKELSYNNISDTDAAWSLVQEFDAATPTVAIIKHANPCGVATGKTLEEAYKRAFSCDSQSAFGGIIALNATIDAPAAEAISSQFAEVIIAPDADEAALAIFAKKKNLRVLLTGEPKYGHNIPQLKVVSGGLLVQDADLKLFGDEGMTTVTKREPTAQEIADLTFAFQVCKHLKSNAIVLAKDGMSVGLGAGQMSRVDSVRISSWKADAAGMGTKGAVLASDAFFPFDDNVHAAHEAGITALIQPGGSIRDEEVIAAADKYDMAMVLTGMRHFRH